MPVVTNNLPTSAHAIFGGVLQTEFPFPELPAIESDRSDWTVRIAVHPSQHVVAVLGEEKVDEHVKVYTSTLTNGFRLQFDDTGIFDITDSGATITWCPPVGVRPELARADFLGGVFSVALHAQGVLCLHGSGVAIGAQAVGFLAAKGSGKSTLAMALNAAGAKLVTDDMLAVDPGPPAMVLPAAPILHLLEDSADQLRRANTADRNPLRGKYKVTNFPAERVATERTRLSAIYELVPRAPDDGEPPVRRVRQAETAAVLSLLRHPKLGESLAHAERHSTFDRAARIVREVPVYKLLLAHDFSRLPQVVGQIMAWHAPGGPQPDGA